jgi:WD40 repeat protein
VKAAFINPISQTIVTATTMGATVWNAGDGSQDRYYDNTLLFGGEAAGAGAELSSCSLDGRRRKLITGDNAGRIRVHNYLNGAMMKELDPHKGEVTALVYCEEEGLVVSTSWDATIHVSDELDQEGYYPFSGSSADVSLAGLSARGDDGREHAPDKSVMLRQVRIEDDDTNSVRARSEMRSRARRRQGGGQGGGKGGGGEGGAGIDKSADVTCVSHSHHLNLLATGARGGRALHHLHVWDFEFLTLMAPLVRPDVLSLGEVRGDCTPVYKRGRPSLYTPI